MPRLFKLPTSRRPNAADYNRLVDAAIWGATSTSDPTSPTRGQVRLRDETVLTSTSMGLEVYYGATTGWLPPWNLPWGQQAIASVSSSQGSITTLTDLTGTGTVTVTTAANRRLLISGIVLFSSTVAGDEATLVIADGSGTTLHAASVPLPKAGNNYTCIDRMFATSATGSNQFKLRAQRVTGSTGTITMVASGTVPAFLLVEDLGPTGAPPAS